MSTFKKLWDAVDKFVESLNGLADVIRRTTTEFEHRLGVSEERAPLLPAPKKRGVT